MRIDARYELAAELRATYWAGTRVQRSATLDHFVAVTGYHRKYALTLLRGRQRKRSRPRRPRVYDAAVSRALRVLWEAAGYVCAERLQPYLPELARILQRHGALSLPAQVQAKLERISIATLKRLLRPIAVAVRGRRLSTTRPGSLLRREIPVELSGFEPGVAGYLEIDLVAHCGFSAAGHFLNTLCATDLATGWTERVAIAGKSRQAVVGAIEQIAGQLPFSLRGLHSDNGSEFLNDLLVNWARGHGIRFTRGRPYHKNDNAHVEQKNWTLVRRLIGYERLESAPQLAWLNTLYTELLRPYNNGFQPVMKLLAKERVGGRVRKRYDRARTPLQRALEVALEPNPALQAFQLLVSAAHPLALKRRIDRTLAVAPKSLEVYCSA